MTRTSFHDLKYLLRSDKSRRFPTRLKDSHELHYVSSSVVWKAECLDSRLILYRGLRLRATMDTDDDRRLVPSCIRIVIHRRNLQPVKALEPDQLWCDSLGHFGRRCLNVWCQRDRVYEVAYYHWEYH